MWENWVIDATMGYPLCFCPVEGDFPDGNYSIVVGMNLIGSPPKGKVVAMIHEGGQEAADVFYAEHKDEIDAALAEARALNSP
jgi:hypothetical protein